MISHLNVALVSLRQADLQREADEARLARLVAGRKLPKTVGTSATVGDLVVNRAR